MSKGWDNTKLKKLKTLSAKGLSTAEIGKELGVSKNAVVGKLNRLGWNLKAGGVPKSGTVPKSSDKKTIAPVKKKPVVKSKVAPKKKEVATKSIVKADVAKKKAATKSNAKPKAVTVAKKTTKPTKPATSKKTKSEEAPEMTLIETSIEALEQRQRIIRHSLGMVNLKPNQCRWPLGDPDTENFHFCGDKVFVGKPYCYEHCKVAFQFTAVKKK